MKFYISTAGCGYKEYAYVTPIAKSENGSDYLCIWTNEKSDMPTHIEGEIVKDLEDVYVEEVEININDYPISKTFLFQFFLNNFKP